MIDVRGLTLAHQALLDLIMPLTKPGEGEIGTLIEFRDALKEHFSLEEAEVFPEAQKAGWTGGTVVIEFRWQHHTLLEQIEGLCDGPADGRAVQLEEFVQQLSQHFTGEEDILFPMVGEMLD